MNTAIKIAAVVAVLAMALGMVVVAEDSDAATYGGFTYETSGSGNNRTAEITDYTGTATEVQIPATFGSGNNSYRVTSIADGAFEGNENITSISIPASVTDIDMGAFDGCTSLSSITVAEGNTEYTAEDGVLYTINGSGNNVTLSLAFCPLAKTGAIEMPENTTSVASGALQNTAITAVVFSDRISTIPSNTFDGCTALESVTLPSAYHPTNGQFPLSGITTLRTVVWNSAEGSTTTYRVLESAFEGCVNLTSVTLPDRTTIIGDSAFAECSSLTSLNIPASVTFIGEGAFQNSGLRTVTIPAGVDEIPESAFAGCASLASVAFAEGSEVTEIGAGAFSGTGLTSFTVPATVTSIGAGAFDSCGALQSIAVAEGNTAYMSVSGVLFTANMQTLVKYPAASTATEYEVPEGVTAVSAGSFGLARNLTAVEMPSSITSIGENAFQGCSALRSVAIESDSFTVGSGAFDIQPEEPATLEIFTDAPAFGDAVFGENVTPSYDEYKNYGMRDSGELMGGAVTWIVIAIVLGIVFLAVSIAGRKN